MGVKRIGVPQDGKDVHFSEVCPDISGGLLPFVANDPSESSLLEERKVDGRPFTCEGEAGLETSVLARGLPHHHERWAIFVQVIQVLGQIVSSIKV